QRCGSHLRNFRLALPLHRLAWAMRVATLAATASRASATRATAAAGTTASAAAGTRGLRVGHLDRDATPVELATVHLLAPVLRLLRRSHLDEPEAARLAREPVRDDGG